MIANTENLGFERKFIAELAEEELADREDGLISPVDLQILSWMIERQSGEELRAFNRSAFQKFGGVEGLLTRFLERTLEARVTTSQRQSAVKVLLALTDLDRQVRAGVLTVSVLKEKLKGSAKPEEVSEAVSWLARGDVRLITPQEQEQAVGYELAHERLIPALMRQAGKELSAADQANRLLDRRVNEWLGNQCQNRYLFGLRELWLIDRQKPYLVWGAKREQKERLLRLSRRRGYGLLAALCLAALVSTGFGSWLKFTPNGQIYQIQWQLSSLLADASDAMVADAAVAFAKHDQWSKAFAITQKYIQKDKPSKPRDQGLAKFVSETSGFLNKVDWSDGQIALLEKLETFANDIQSDGSKSDALRAIANASVELSDPDKAAEVLANALAAAQNIQDDGSKSDALRTIVNEAVVIDDESLVQNLLREALQISRKEKSSMPMVEISNFHAQQSDWAQVLDALRTCENKEKTIALSQNLTILAEHNNPELIKGAVVLENGPNGIEYEGQPDNYTFTATIQSPDQDCERHADWWEVLTPDGILIKRQLVDKVHKTERPFSSTMPSVKIQPDQAVIVRAHFNGTYFSGPDPLVDERFFSGHRKSGYTDQALLGSIADGFKSVRLSENFAKGLENKEPLPDPEACVDE
ncbi:MAG: hypothetical protein AAFV72_04595 [Cyanobacteria bacterium J06635_1]